MRIVFNNEKVSQEFIKGMKSSSADPAWCVQVLLRRRAVVRLDGFAKMLPGIGCVSSAWARTAAAGHLIC